MVVNGSSLASFPLHGSSHGIPNVLIFVSYASEDLSQVILFMLEVFLIKDSDSPGDQGAKNAKSFEKGGDEILHGDSSLCGSSSYKLHGQSTLSC